MVTHGLGVRLSSNIINNRSGQVRVNISTGLVHRKCLSNDHSLIPSLVGSEGCNFLPGGVRSESTPESHVLAWILPPVVPRVFASQGLGVSGFH